MALTETERLRLYIAAIVAALFLGAFGGMWVGFAQNQNTASQCSDEKKAPSPTLVEGVLTKHPSYQRFYVSRSGQEWPVYRCYRGGCPKYGELVALLGADAVATFCGDEFVALDIKGQRIVSRDVSHTPTIVGGLIIVGLAVLCVGLLVFGDRKLHFAKSGRESNS